MIQRALIVEPVKHCLRVEAHCFLTGCRCACEACVKAKGGEVKETTAAPADLFPEERPR